MGPVDPVHACLLHVLSTRGLPSMGPILAQAKESLTEIGQPLGDAVPLGLCASLSPSTGGGHSWSRVTGLLGLFSVCAAPSTTAPARLPSQWLPWGRLVLERDI